MSRLANLAGGSITVFVALGLVAIPALYPVMLDALPSSPEERYAARTAAGSTPAERMTPERKAQHLLAIERHRHVRLSTMVDRLRTLAAVDEDLELARDAAELARLERARHHVALQDPPPAEAALDGSIALAGPMPMEPSEASRRLYAAEAQHTITRDNAVMRAAILREVIEAPR